MKNVQKIKLFVIALFASISIFSSCNKDVDITVTKDFADLTFEVPVTPAVGEFTQSRNVVTNFETMAKEKGFDINKIKSIKVKALTLTIKDTSSSPITFDIIDRVYATFMASGVSDAVAASIDPVEHNGSTTITIPAKDIDVAPYLKANNFDIKFLIANNAPIDHIVPMSANVTFEIVATAIDN